MSTLSTLHDIAEARWEIASEAYHNWHTDRMRNAVGLPSLHARFTGPTPRKHYSRRERRRRRWL